MVIVSRSRAGTRRRSPSSGPPSATSTPSLAVIEADVTDEDSFGRALMEFHNQLGSVEVLVHLVGAWHGGEPVQDQSLETWRRVTDLNLTSAFLCAHAVLPEMLDGGWGRLVMVSSRTAREGRNAQSTYAVAKEGVATLAEVIADECCGTGVTADTIAPSVLDTPANRSAMPSADFTRWVQPDVAAAMVAFLLSEDAGTLRARGSPCSGPSEASADASAARSGNQWSKGEADGRAPEGRRRRPQIAPVTLASAKWVSGSDVMASRSSRQACSQRRQASAQRGSAREPGHAARTRRRSSCMRPRRPAAAAW